MNSNQNTKEKICAFFASDYHFEMISLPYIEKNLEENKKVIVLTENNLKDTINTFMSKVNLDQNKKKEIINLNWQDNDLIKFKEIKEETIKGNELILLVKGKKNYIKNINENIENLVPNKKNLTIIDCYDIQEISEEAEEISSNYTKLLSTTGIKDMQKL